MVVNQRRTSPVQISNVQAANFFNFYCAEVNRCERVKCEELLGFFLPLNLTYFTYFSY